jgi:hypothetical protein
MACLIADRQQRIAIAEDSCGAVGRGLAGSVVNDLKKQCDSIDRIFFVHRSNSP